MLIALGLTVLGQPELSSRWRGYLRDVIPQADRLSRTLTVLAIAGCGLATLIFGVWSLARMSSTTLGGP